MMLIRLGLAIFSFRTLLTFLRSRRQAQSGQPALDQHSVKRAMWGIKVLTPYIPGVTCLTQALAALTLLENSAETVSVRIGVTKGAEGELKAHAWVESNGEVIIGHRNDLRSYRVLSRLEEVRQ